ncbi:BatD family protein [Rhodobacteraceae bacterium B1Z28]|uniref:BatD family protein n=1 Tax=Ruegeria haliotis TaxID=2747601 RepID=A0ABX2PUJ1_9RHOB|nr:BatD family protein [Ruegeria haliotis]NVO56689.1 BatD family protein [Ruegeria haliotis]
MKWLILIGLLIPVQVMAQSKTVLPSELSIEVSIDDNSVTPFTHEMILVTIRGIYGRHVTREQLIQPDFDGFSWAQLGPDSWSEERIDGRNFKVFTRSMAIYPVRPGKLTIGRFTHNLTLTDENDNWFGHAIQSEPLTIEVAEAPATAGWWFPVRNLKISDQWSNAPDQLSPGEGVLRMIRIEALGATPEMIPPMPELRSPSAMIFAHPEKRLVELTPEGPVTYAFWRWTIRPTNDTSGIVEPLQFSYFDTIEREDREVTISAQRIAYGTVSGQDASPQTTPRPPEALLPGWPAAMLAVAVFLIGVGAGMSKHRLIGWRAPARFSFFDPLAWQLRRFARTGQVARLRQTAAAMVLRDVVSETRRELIMEFDRRYFDPKASGLDLMDFARRFLRAGGYRASGR